MILWTMDVHRRNETKTNLWFGVPQEFGNMLSPLADAALVALLLPSMERSEDIEVQGIVSEELLYNLAGPVQSLLQAAYPNLRRVAIRSEEQQSMRERATGVATGFSGGVDSLALIWRHYLSDDIPDQERLTHLLFNNVGSHVHGGKPGGDEVFKSRFDRLTPAAKQFGLPLIPVHSNLATHQVHSFVRTHTLLNSSVALVLQSGIRKFLSASDFSWKSIGVGSGHQIALMAPIILPLISTRYIDLRSSGSEYTRFEKTDLISLMPSACNFLDVCVRHDGGGNCSCCGKCMRTQLTLELLGKLHNFEGVFDLEVYHAERSRYLRSLYSHSTPDHEELRRIAEVRGVMPWSCRIRGVGRYVAGSAYRGLLKRLSPSSP